MVSPERLDALQRGFARLLETYGVAAADAYPLFDRLVAAYGEPHRHYHTLEHVGEVLRVAGRLAQSPAVALAVWFHDAVYDPTRNDNEDRSADLAGRELTALGLDPSTVTAVAALVRATAHLGAGEPPADAETRALLDADLAILGAAPVRYDRYAADIRREYGHVPGVQYARGRVAVLDRFLARPRLYFDERMVAEGDGPARVNLAAERARLLAEFAADSAE